MTRSGADASAYRQIYVPLDNSEHSNAAIEVAVELAAAFGAGCVGCHVYAARMHDYRFKQMEYTLPEEYQDEAELLRQRRIHDSLITTGLQLISDSYSDVMRYRCMERGVPFESRMLDGKNWQSLVEDINDPTTAYDLVVMGALGMGAVKESRLGSVTDRVVRRIRTDTIVVRSTAADTGDAGDGGGILVAIDGSPQCFGGLRTALALGRVLDRPVEAVAVYDPYLHYAVFNSIVDVLSEKASKVFRFKEQEALHEEIIDTGLAKIYESHLKVARATAAEEGAELPITLLDGKAFEQVLRYARERRPWLLVTGRIGVHSDSAMDLGSTTDQLIRLAPCNVLVSSRTHVPPIDTRAEASVVWTPEAEERMERIPAAARGIARNAVLGWCTERGHSVVSSGDVDAAIDELMPFQRTLSRIGEVADTLHSAERAMREEPSVEQARAVCDTCGYAARAESPSVCPVCGGPPEGFQRLDVAGLLAAAASEGDASETGFDGRKLGWTMEARSLLHQLPAGYLRRRVKAIIEKAARTRRLPAITADIVEPHVRRELEVLDAAAAPHRAPLPPSSPEPEGGAVRRLPWTAEAESRLERIPEGFLRNLVREQVERLVLQLSAPEVGALHVEAGIGEARARMRETLGASNGDGRGCPMHGHNGAGAPAAAPDDALAEQRGGLNEVTAGVVESLGRRQAETPRVEVEQEVTGP
jgi:nucleotide-binding universal stress UspA family protein/predicted Zn-ribbon and HTH transcriptional regulator